MSILSRPQATQPALARPTWVRWQIIAFVMMFIFVGHFNRISLTVAADMRIMKDYRISPTQMGFIYTTFLAVYTLCMIPGGLLIDRIGVRRSYGFHGFGLVFAAVLTSALYVMFGPEIAEFSLGFYALLFCTRVLQGVAAAPMHPAGAQAVGHWIPLGAQTWANGLITGMCPLGIASAYVLMEAMIGWFNWPIALLIMAAVTLTLTVAWLFFAADHPHHHRRVNAAEIGLIEAGRVQSSTNAKSARELEIEEDLEELEHEMVEASLPYDHDPAQHEPLWRDRNLLVLTLSYSLNGYFQYLFFYWLHYYFYDQMKLDAGKAGFYSAIPLLTMAAGMPLGGLISDWIQPRVGRLRSRAVVAITGMSAASVFLFIALTAAEPAWIAFWLALSMGSLGTSESAFWATVIDSAGKRSGAASAFVNAGNNGFGLLAPVVTPLVSSLAGWTFAISLAGVASFASAMCWFWIKPTAVDMPTAEANSLATS